MSTMQEIALSDYGSISTQPSPVADMMASFANDFRPDVDINLGVGYVSEATIPRELIERAVSHIVRYPDRYHAPFNYGSPEGSTRLFEALKRFYTDRRIGVIDEELFDKQRIVVGASGATSLLDGISQVLKPGIVITTDPMYYIYCHQLERSGFELVTVPEDSEGINVEVLDEKLDQLGDRCKEISFVYIVSISNPTCSILSNPRRKALVDRVTRLSEQLGRKVPLIIDSAYELLFHNVGIERPVSCLKFDELGIVYELGTLSKVLAPALRIGYMIGPSGPFVDAMVQKVSDTGFSAPLLSQEIAAYLLNEHAQTQLEQVNAGYRVKAKQMCQWIDDEFADELEYVSGGDAGFYFYLTFRTIPTHRKSAFFRMMTVGGERPRVVYLPGEFCVHPHGDMVEIGQRQMRLSYGYEDSSRIETAIRTMGQAVRELRV